MEKEGRRQPGAGRLGEHPCDVVERCDPMEPEVPPTRIDGRIHYPGFAGLFLFIRDVRAVPTHLAPHQRIALGTDGLGVGRHVDASAVRTHLVVVDVGLGNPIAEQNLRPVLRLHRVGHESVAVIVVTDVWMVQIRHARRIVLGPHPPIVPVRDHDLAVGIEARDHDRNAVIENSHDLTVRARNQIVHQLRRHLAGTTLGRVQSHRLDHHGLTVGDRPLDRRFRHSARIAQRGVDLTQLLESREIFGRRDEQNEEWGPPRRGPHVHHFHSGALLAEQVVVFDKLVPAGQLAVGPHLVAEELFRRWYLSRPEAGRQGQRHEKKSKTE